MMLGFTVTDSQLLATKYVTLILLVIVIVGLFINLVQLAKAVRTEVRIRKLVFSSLLFLIIFPIYATYEEESSMLASNKYTVGLTIEYCDVSNLGTGVMFSYVVDGHTYTNCDTYHPIPRDSIKIPNGKYMVRYSTQFPDKGRIDLRKPTDQGKENTASEITHP